MAKRKKKNPSLAKSTKKGSTPTPIDPVEDYLPVPEPEDDGLVVVQDFDPNDPGAPVAEPQKVFNPHDRIARKRARGSRE